MKIRIITAKDDQAICDIIKASLEAADLAIPGTAYFDPELAHLSAYYGATPRRDYFILLDDEGTVIGGVGVAEFDEAQNVAELQKLYLKPAARGKGAANLLMETAINFAKGQAYHDLYLESHHSLVPALKLYEKYGFKELGQPLLETPHNAMDRFMLLNLAN